MKVCAAKSVSRVAVKVPSARRARITVMSAANKGKQVATKSNKVAMAAALTTLTATAPALAAVNEVGQVAGAEFLPSVFVSRKRLSLSLSLGFTSVVIFLKQLLNPIFQTLGSTRRTCLPSRCHGSCFHLLGDGADLLACLLFSNSTSSSSESGSFGEEQVVFFSCGGFIEDRMDVFFLLLFDRMKSMKYKRINRFFT